LEFQGNRTLHGEHFAEMAFTPISFEPPGFDTKLSFLLLFGQIERVFRIFSL